MTKLNVHQRMAQAMKQVTYIQKEQKQGMRYSIVSHDAVTAKVRPALLEAGVHYYPLQMDINQDGNRTECTMLVRFVNIDDPNDSFSVATAGYGIDPQDKGPGKAISYAVKYALLKAMGLETGDDPDMDQDVQHEPKPTFSELKREDVWPKFEAALNDCQNEREVDRLKAEYRVKVKEDRWPKPWVDSLGDAFAMKMKVLEEFTTMKEEA